LRGSDSGGASLVIVSEWRRTKLLDFATALLQRAFR
jgi:hypothetical protein